MAASITWSAMMRASSLRYPMPRNAPSARSRASATLRRRRLSVMMIASSAHRIGPHDDARRYRKHSVANGAHGMIRPCSGLDRKKSWQGGDNDEEHAMSYRLITEPP